MMSYLIGSWADPAAGGCEENGSCLAYQLTLDQAPHGYKDFDRGAAKKFVIDTHGLLKKAA